FGRRIVQRLAFDQPRQPALRFAALARGFLLLPLCLDALVLFLLRTDRIGLGQVDVLAQPARRRPLAALLRRRLAARRLAVRLAVRLGGRLETEAEELVAE